MSKFYTEVVQRVSADVTEFIKGLIVDQPNEERAIAWSNVWEQINNAFWELDEMVWLMDVYDDGGQTFAIGVSRGKLVQVPVSINGDDVTLGELIPVEAEFLPTARTIIRQQENGSYRWFSISATAVLNKSGVIDSRDLFDSFVEFARTTGIYPIRMFFHQGEEFKTGEADFLARDGNVYLTSGVYDDGPLAMAEIRALQEDPDAWGESIGFIPTAEPELFEIAEGINIPVYTQGVNREISTLPEGIAAHFFTQIGITEERTMKEEVLTALRKLFGDDEDGFNSFVQGVDVRNREIDDDGLITREEEETEVPAAETETREIELDEEVITALIAGLVGSEEFSALRETVTSLTEVVTTLTAQVEERASAVDVRLAGLEETDDEKRRKWQEDLPPAASESTVVTYRAREQNDDAADEEPQSYAQRAEAAHDGIKTY